MITIELNQKLDENGIEILAINYDDEYGYYISSLYDESGKLINNYDVDVALEALSINNTGSTTIINFENYPITEHGYTHIQIKSYNTSNDNELVRASKWIPIASLLEDYTNPVSFDDDNSLVLFDVGVYGDLHYNYPDDFDWGTDEYDDSWSTMNSGGSITSLTELPGSSIDIENISIKLTYDEDEVILTTDEQGYFGYDFPTSGWGGKVTAEVINPGAIGKKSEYTTDGSS